MKLTKEEIIRRFYALKNKLNRKPVKRDSSYLYFLSRKYLGSWSNLLKEGGYDIKLKQYAKMPSLNKKEFYYFLGLLCTDGHIQFNKEKGKYKLIIFTSNKEEKDMIFNLIYSLFSYKASLRSKIYGFSKRPNYEVYISSKKLCEFFGNLGIPFGAKSLIIKLPEIIKRCSDLFFWSFVRGIFDGDGSIINSKNNWTFKIASGSRRFLEELNNLFLKKGFSPILRREKENIWILKIHKKNEINHLYSLIYKDSKDYYYTRKRLKWENNNF
jgi:hypothetical protein